MKTTVETRFDVGDIVYVADHYYDLYPISKPYVVRDVVVRVTSDSIHIHYEIEKEGILDYVPEEWVFETYTECTKWCDEHN